MNKPFAPRMPYEHEYKASKEAVYIYEFYEELDPYNEREDDEDDEKEKHVPIKDISEVNLEWLLTLVPPGIKLKDIKVAFGYNASSMAFEDHYVGFYYEKEIPARPKEYKAALKQYKIDFAKYEKDLEIYNEEQREKEIKET